MNIKNKNKTKDKTTKQPQSKTNKQNYVKIAVWFLLGASLGLMLFTGSVLVYYKEKYNNKIYPGVYVAGVDFGSKTKDQVISYFDAKNGNIDKTEYNLTYQDQKINFSAKDLSAGYDSKLLADQAYTVGRNDNSVSALYYMAKAYINGVDLDPSYTFDREKLHQIIKPFSDTIDVEPVNAEFNFKDGKVLSFKSHVNGKKVDTDDLEDRIYNNFIATLNDQKPRVVNLSVKVETIEPEVKMEEVNDLGIKEPIGVGTSSYKGSIANRAYNIGVATNKLNGLLIKPGEVFSFANAVGDISVLTGYKQAYVIQNGRTVLGDGGGVCQVSTTLFRAILNAGLPVVERNPHAYRVSYYEQDKGPGFDAAVYVPSVDLKFKNDTDHYVLIQTNIDPTTQELTYTLYGTSDGRSVKMSDSVILSTSPAPEALYQDDPELPAGEVKQVDWAAPGAKVYFTRTVSKNGEVIIQDKFESNYRPWQAVYLRGTKV